MFQFEEQGDKSICVLLTELKVMPSAPHIVVKPTVQSDSRQIKGLPLLDLVNLQSCNCKKDSIDSLFCSQSVEAVEQVAKDVGKLDIEDKENIEDIEDSEYLNTRTLDFQIKGSTYNDCSQHALKVARGNCDDCTICFEFEPDNIADINAIKILRTVINNTTILGYIPKERINQFTHFIKSNSIVSSKLVSVTRKYVPMIKKNIYLGELCVQVTGHIPAIDNDYKYNQVLV